MKKLGLLFVMLMVSICIFAKGELKTIVYTTNPIMHCEGCENKIKNYLKFEKGIKKIVTDVPNQTVTITYDDSKTTPEKIEAAFGKISYTVKQVCPNAKGGCCKAEGGCPKAEGGCPKAEGGCPKAEGGCCQMLPVKTDCCKKQ